jgi:hypothetical protein
VSRSRTCVRPACTSPDVHGAAAGIKKRGSSIDAAGRLGHEFGFVGTGSHDLSAEVVSSCEDMGQGSGDAHEKLPSDLFS